MSSSQFAILDPAAGISGDMLLGALIDAGAPEDWLVRLPARLGIPEVTIDVATTDRCGIRATRVVVRTPHGVEGYGEPHGDHHHEHHLPHTRVGSLLERIDRAPISEWVRARARKAFELLGEAEGKVHGVSPADVSLHEVGALDALVDIVGGIEGFERLGIERVTTRPVVLGSGWVRAAHGTLPVPAPATAELVSGLPIGENGPVSGEATTPTGAALLRVLVSDPMPERWRLRCQGWGAGERNPVGYPNALRLLVASTAAEAAEVTMIATDVDDLPPEYLEPLRAGLLEAGALDVQIWSTQGKKGRLSFRVEAAAPKDVAEEVTRAFFRHSTTAGVRRWTATRATLAREMIMVGQGASAIRAKVRQAPDGPRGKAEFEDVAAVAKTTGRPAIEIAEAAQAQIHESIQRNVSK